MSLDAFQGMFLIGLSKERRLMKQGKRLTTEQIEQMRAYKAEGHSSAEVGIMFGVTENTAQKYCRGISRMDSTTQFKGLTDEEVNSAVKKYNKNLIYHSGFTKGDCAINVQCTVCGNIFQRSFVTIRHGSAKNACPYCLSTEKEKNRRRIVEEKKKSREERHAIAVVNAENRRLQKMEETRKRQETRRHDCPVCGKSTTRRKYCSDKCCAKANWNSSAHEARRRVKIRAKYIDKDITLKRLYNRDGGQCWICGLMCDYTDKTYRDKYMIAGDMYPSIDHVVALSDGGAHSWDNVRLAHRICNTMRYYIPAV